MIIHNELCESIANSLTVLFECAVTPTGEVQVCTPILYPDGGVVDVFVKKAPDHYVVTDYGDALGWLLMQSANGKLSPKQRSLLDDLLLTQNIALDNGELQVRCWDLASLSEAVQLVSQTVVLISDLQWKESPRRPVTLGGNPC